MYSPVFRDLKYGILNAAVTHKHTHTHVAIEISISFVIQPIIYGCITLYACSFLGNLLDPFTRGGPEFMWPVSFNKNIMVKNRKSVKL